MNQSVGRDWIARTEGHQGLPGVVQQIVCRGLESCHQGLVSGTVQRQLGLDRGQTSQGVRATQVRRSLQQCCQHRQRLDDLRWRQRHPMVRRRTGRGGQRLERIEATHQALFWLSRPGESASVAHTLRVSDQEIGIEINDHPSLLEIVTERDSLAKDLLQPGTQPNEITDEILVK